MSAAPLLRIVRDPRADLAVFGFLCLGPVSWLARVRAAVGLKSHAAATAQE
jgi:hypothetical protein